MSPKKRRGRRQLSALSWQSYHLARNCVAVYHQPPCGLADQEGQVMETMKDVVEAIQQGKLLVVTFRAGIDEKES